MTPEKEVNYTNSYYNIIYLVMLISHINTVLFFSFNLSDLE